MFGGVQETEEVNSDGFDDINYANDDHHGDGDVDDVDDKNNNHGTRRKTSQ